MIGRAMNEWPDDALRRVVDAPLEMWADGGNGGRGAPRCLYEHAFGNGYHKKYGLTGALYFDRLARRFGRPRTVRACKQRALAILLRRHPLDSRLKVLSA